MRTPHHNEKIQSSFREFVHEQAFPCIGAKAALAHNQISFCIADNIKTASSDADVTEKLQAFTLSCTSDCVFVSFVVIFQNSPLLNEIEFDRFLWERLQAIHDRDTTEHAWDTRVSSDPQSPHFSMSFGGKGFYIVGLHPNASRLARQFIKPALVFNLHSQFELLRDEGGYDRLRETIIARDIRLSGSANPMLAQHGESSEARQYSGRLLDDEWKCPFHARKKSHT